MGEKNVQSWKITGHMAECLEISTIELGHKISIHFHRFYFGFELKSQMRLYCHLPAVLCILARILIVLNTVQQVCHVQNQVQNKQVIDH